MYLSVPSNQLRLVESILRDHNVHPIEAHLPVIGGTQLLNIRDDQIAKNVIQRLKNSNCPVTVTSTV
jgi:hypothetical protein